MGEMINVGLYFGYFHYRLCLSPLSMEVEWYLAGGKK
ncbi:MAG: hypothetical protein MRERV_14c040 [Mycoplasmataceae bacterium RV_VA103A]|nr:MAG: hypothetical protein MRERV_14c040 [Mycoplasmataceae bacterium RV_VA103A]